MSNLAIDQRTEPRLALPANNTATMSVLDGLAIGAPIEVGIVNFSGRGLRLSTNQPYAAGTLVRIDLNRTMMLGEVCYSEPSGDGSFAIGLRLEHSLLQTESLIRLRERFAEEDQPMPVSR